MAILLVTIMVISGLPVVNEFRAHATASTPRSAAVAPTPVATTARSIPASATSVEAVDVSPSTNASLCLLGIEAKCATPTSVSGLSLAGASTTPSADPPSSWTNITPPTTAPNPGPRELPAEAYDPAAHATILYGGDDGAFDFLSDTWSYANNRWTEVNNGTNCTANPCPEARDGAMMAYDPQEDGMILFGGFWEFPGLHGSLDYAYNDTWLFANGTWTDLTSTVGNAPSPRFSGAMTYDPSDNYVLLFGGATVNGNALGDTWKFSDGVWTNITSAEGGATGYSSLKAPEPRAGAAIATSPNGYVMLYGGMDRQDNGSSYIIQNWCDNGSYESEGNSTVAWWFYHGVWTPVNGWGDTYTGPCEPIIKAPAASPSATPAVTSVVPNPPCGRVDAALGWSPKNAQFVLYGGYGSTDQDTNSECSGGPAMLNDTWLFGNYSGGGSVWHSASDSGDPSARAYMGYSSDFTSDYFEIFGGALASGAFVNQSWRFFEYVHAKLTGPSTFDTAIGIHLLSDTFIVTGYGGSGNLSYTLSAQGLKTSNIIDCSEFTDGKNLTLPFNGTVSFACEPKPDAYNVYRLTLTVYDKANATDHARSTWIYEVVPPESMAVYSEYGTYFYQTLAVTNTFTVYAEVNNASATSLKATLAGNPITFHKTAGSPRYWNATYNMSSVPKGAILRAEGFWGNWTLNATYNVSMVAFPSWLQNVFTGSGPNQTFVAHGAGPFNKTYTINDSYSWNVASGFSLPIELLGGDYNVIPSLGVNFTVSSTGNLTINGTLPLTSTSIDLGPASLSLGIGFTLGGTFNVEGTGVHWDTAFAQITAYASLGADIPIYGFDILGFTVGFTLDVEINVSAALKLILAPTTDPSDDILPNIGIMIQNLIGTLTLALSASVDFGIGIASVGLGAGVSVALEFQTQPNFAIYGGWVNGSIFVTASFLFWSDSWNITSGTIYSWDGPGVEPPWDNGSGTNWSLANRYYNITGYDANVWNPATTSGPAIADIYPSTEVAGAAGYNGAYLFYSNDNTSEPVRDGLGISGARLNTSSNDFSALPSPDDPGYVIFSPRATTLPDGNIYVVWDALPAAEESLKSPLDLTSLALQGAEFYPLNGSWGAIRTFSTAGFPESYQVDATNSSGDVVELVSSQPLVNSTTDERLVEFDLTTGVAVNNASVSGVSEVVSVRAEPGLAVLQLVNGNYTVVSLATGTPLAISYVPPAKFVLTSATFVSDSASLLVLLYAGPNASKIVLYDTSDGTTVGALAVKTDATEAEAIASGTTVYVFDRIDLGVRAFSETGGKFTLFDTFELPNVASYGLVQAGGSVLVYALATNGTTTEPLVTLSLAEVAAALAPVPVPSGAAPTSTSSSTSSSYLVYLAIGAGVVALVLVAVAIRARRRPPVAPPSPPPGTTGAADAGTGTSPPPSG